MKSTSARFDTLELVNTRLNEMGIALSLSEVKGPVMDRLQRGDLLEHLTGKVYLSQFDAFHALTHDPIS